MLEQALSEYLQQLELLTDRQRTRLARVLSGPANPSLGEISARPANCPYCGASAEQLNPWGQSHGLPRYRCHDCGKTCNPLTGTPLAHLRKREQWSRYAQAMIDDVSVRAAAKQCQIDKNTAFLWRHRFLRQIAQHQATHESGIVEADETFFLESFKGQRHLPRPARRRGRTNPRHQCGSDRGLGRARPQWRDGQFPSGQAGCTPYHRALRPLIATDAVLCTDGASVYQTFARLTGVAHRALNVQQGIRVIDGVFHIQNVNAYDSHLKTWMRRFNGVATKYLDNYLGWRRLLERYRDAISPARCLNEAAGRWRLNS